MAKPPERLPARRSSNIARQRADENAVVEVDYRAPLPLPSMFAQYDRVLPGSAERILRNMEKNSAHRRAVVEKNQDNSFFLNKGYLVLMFLGMGVACFALWWSYRSEGSDALAVAGAVIATASLGFPLLRMLRK